MGDKAFTLVNGKMSIDKDPDDVYYYGVNLIDDLTASDTEIDEIDSFEPVGVTVEGEPFVQGTFAMALVSGGNPAAPSNFLRFRVRYKNGERTDRTLYFLMVTK